MRRRVLLGIAGAPTVVVDASLCACRDVLGGGWDVLGVQGGPKGLLAGNFNEQSVTLLQTQPRAGTVLGAGRLEMTEEAICTVVDNLIWHDIDALVMAGGNGTMSLLTAIAAEASSRGLPVQVVGIPKTIDNDLFGVDFSPGFASAARYLSVLVPAIARDHAAMADIEPVRVVETMGRSGGWLAAAAASAMFQAGSYGSICLVPEMGETSEPEILSSVERSLSVRSRAFVICSEGYTFRGTENSFDAQNHSSLLLGGTARRLARAIGGALAVPARGEVLGTQQRSAHFLASSLDLKCALELGATAGRLILRGLSGVMAGSQSEHSLPPNDLIAVELESVAGRHRSLLPEYIPLASENLSRYARWLSPLIVR